MENASKALLLAGAVLIAVLVLSIATQMFKSAYEVPATYDVTMQSAEVRSFNDNFTKYYGSTKTKIDQTTGTEKTETTQHATIHDVISLCNFVRDYNKKMDTEDITDSTHVRVNIQGANPAYKIENLEAKPQIYNTLLKNCYYGNPADPNVNFIIHFNINIDKYNAVGSIQEVTFSADNGAIDTLIRE